MQENQEQTNQFVQLSSNPVIRPKQNNFIAILLSILLFISVAIAGFFAYQTQQLNRQLKLVNENLLNTQNPNPTFEPGLEPEPVPIEILTKDWKSYKDDKLKLSFKYPVEAKFDNNQLNILRVSYMGKKQIASGRTQTELFDGYSFSIGDVSSDGKSLSEIYTKHKQNFITVCDEKNISEPSKVKVDGYDALRYTTSCLGDFTNNIIDKNGLFYDINILVTGDSQDYPQYQKVTDQILLTVQFTN